MLWSTKIRKEDMDHLWSSTVSNEIKQQQNVF